MNRAAIVAAMPPGRWLTTAEVQRLVAREARTVWPRRTLGLQLGFMAKAGLLQRETHDRDRLYRRTA